MSAPAKKHWWSRRPSPEPVGVTVRLDRPLTFIPLPDGSVDVEGPGIVYSNIVRPSVIRLVVRLEVEADKDTTDPRPGWGW